VDEEKREPQAVNAAYPLWYASENLTRRRGKDQAGAADVSAHEYKAGVLSSSDFSALKIDTRDWKFNREEANERR
jgi:hypothetical protein